MRASSVGGLAASLVLIACLPARAGIADAILQGVIQGVASGVTEHALNHGQGPVAQESDGYVVYERLGRESPVDDDAAPPCAGGLTPSVAALVAARQGVGLSAAGFYNDPDLALAARYAPVRHGYVASAPAGSTVVVGSYGHYGHYSHSGAHYAGARFGGAHYAGGHFGGAVRVK